VAGAVAGLRPGGREHCVRGALTLTRHVCRAVPVTSSSTSTQMSLASPRHPACRAHLGQVIDVCTRVNPRLVVKRARFSALVRTQLERAFARLVEPDEAASKAVDARQEIDLRIGASFTRFQSKLLQVSPGCQAAAAFVKAGVCMWNMKLASRGYVFMHT